MYLCSSALLFFIDWDFSLGHMSMDLSSVLAALSSPMVPSVTGTINQVASPHGCLPGLAGPEPSGPLINPGQHLHKDGRGGPDRRPNKDKNANQSGGNPNTTPGGNSKPSGGQSNTGPTTRSQAQAQQEQGTTRAKEDGDQSHARKRPRFMRMARKLQKKGFEVTCPAEF